MTKRIIIRLLLLAALLVAVVVVVYALETLTDTSEAVWAALAGALAVVTSVISAFIAQRVLEIQEDTLLPEPYPSFDFKSRYSLAQLRVTNGGGSSAYRINLEWRNPIFDFEGKEVRFPHNEGTPEIPILLSKESVSIPIGASHQFINGSHDLNYSGCIEYEDARGTKHKREFFLSAEMYKKSLVYSEEETRTHYELQKIPKEIENLKKEVVKLGLSLKGRDKSDNGA